MVRCKIGGMLARHVNKGRVHQEMLALLLGMKFRTFVSLTKLYNRELDFRLK